MSIFNELSQAGSEGVPVERREGRQFERTLRAIAYLLSGWYEFHRRDEEPGGTMPAMRAIAFDKLVTAWARIWDAGFRRGRGAMEHAGGYLGLEEETLNERRIRFPCPLRELQGKHGRGRARVGGEGKPLFIGELLYQSQARLSLGYFEVEVPELFEDGRPKPPDPSDPRTVFKCGTPITNEDEFLSLFSVGECKLLRELFRALRRCSEEEIRALGTHASKRQTLEDIWREFRFMHERSLFARLREGLERGRVLADAAREMEGYADEAFRKSVGNQKAYRDARQKVLREIADAEVREIVSSVQAPADEIWDDDLDGSVRLAKLGSSLARYLRLLGELQGQAMVGGVLGDARDKELSAAAASLVRQGYDAVPASRETAFEPGTGVLRSKAKEILCEIVGEVRALLSSGFQRVS